MNNRKLDHAAIKAAKGSADEIARAFGCSASYVRLLRKGRVGESNPHSRQTAPSLSDQPAHLPAFNNAAIMQGVSLFHSTVTSAAKYPHALLKSGYMSTKIGRAVTKGRWKGFPIFTLTLEERATCPRSCGHWRSCFGNHMQHAHRLAHGLDLEQRLIGEICALADRHPGGYAVRLHVLGDFYSVRYVELWEMLLGEVPQLHAFGFSARWDTTSDPIAMALVKLVLKNWDRFAIRFSDAPIDECATVSIEHPFQKPADAIICPQQLGKTACCGTCALCWQSKRRVAFIHH